MSGHGVELHGSDLVLRENGEQGRHLVLAVPKGYLVHDTSTYALQLLLKRFA
jgi:hypothetical protein